MIIMLLCSPVMMLMYNTIGTLSHPVSTSILQSVVVAKKEIFIKQFLIYALK